MHNPPRLLIVDDDPDDTCLMAAALEGEGYEIVTARDGEQGLAQIGATSPDLILLDIMLPKLDGLEVCRRLKSDTNAPFIPIIFITGKTESSDVAIGLDAGGDDFLSKPFSPITLAARVRAMMRIKVLHEEIAERNRQLESLSRLDGLTGIANRRWFDDTLHHEYLRLAREREPLSLILGDIDHFKRFNDRYGHLEGDDCLRKIASVFAAACRRPADLAARYGGEELVLILPDTTLKAASRIGESVRQAVERMAIPHVDSAVNCTTLSVGVASVIPDPRGSPVSLVERADQALYRAKQQGRNRCVTFTELPEPGTKQRTPAEVVLTGGSPRGAGPKSAGKR